MTRVGHTSGPKTSEPRHLWTTLVVHFVHCFVIFFGVVGLVSSRFFQQYQWYRHRSFGISLRSFFLSLFFLSPPNDLWGERREKKIKKLLHLCSSFRILLTYFFVPLNSSCQDLFKDIGCVIIRVSMYLQDVFISFLFSPLFSVLIKLNVF